MTNEEKELLIKDLCARLPHGVIVRYKSMKGEGTVKLGYNNITYVSALGRGWWIECKPYLRPMSSMTEEEKKEIGELLDASIEIDSDGNIIYFSGTDFIPRSDYQIYIDYLTSHYFDYRGLIPMGLALPAKEGMYNKMEE